MPRTFRALAATIILFAIATDVSAESVRATYLPELKLRARIMVAAKPQYPVDAANQRIVGVVVSELAVSPRGSVQTVTVLEAPCQSIGRAAADALRTWVFKPIQGDRLRIGKITLYFSNVNGAFAVLDPIDTVYVGQGGDSSRKGVHVQ